MTRQKGRHDCFEVAELNRLGDITAFILFRDCMLSTGSRRHLKGKWNTALARCLTYKSKK